MSNQNKMQQSRVNNEVNLYVRSVEKPRLDSWAARITQKVSPEVIAKIQEDEKKIKAENDAKLAKINQARIKEQQRKREIYEKYYEPNMQKKYGLKKAFVIPPINYWWDEIRISIGDFWEFKIEGTRNDSELAKSRRKNPENRHKFHSYLEQEYGRNWLEASEDKEDDCPNLRDLREKKRKEQEQEEYEREERQREQRKEIEKEMEEKEKKREEMKLKFQSGEITRKQYNKWKSQVEEEEWEEHDNYQTEGLGIWGKIEMQNIADSARLARKTERGK